MVEMTKQKTKTKKKKKKKKKKKQKAVGNNLCLHVMSAKDLATRSCKENIADDHHGHQRVFLIAGERGSSWKEKRTLAEQASAVSDRSAVTAMVDGADSGHAPVWNYAVFVSLDGLQNPEVSMRVMDDSVDGGGLHVIGETTVPITMQRFSTGSHNDSSGTIKCRLHSLDSRDSSSQGTLLVKWSRPKAMKSGTGKMPKASTKLKMLRVTAGRGPLGLTLTPGFMGVGARVGAFSDDG